jgi:hypothetical protein
MCACDERAKLFKKVIPMDCEKGVMFNIETHCSMPLFMEESIIPKFDGIIQGIVFT